MPADKKLRAKTPKRPSKELLERISEPPQPVKRSKQPGKSRTPTSSTSTSTGLTRKQAERQPSHLRSFVIRMLPVWALLLMVLIIAIPMLPRIGGWVGDLLPRRPNPGTDPVFIIEGPEGQAPSTELPPPNWPLEISVIFTPEIQYWEPRISEWSLAYRIKPNMIATIMQIESCGNPEAFSNMGAQGLFQVMPLHFDPDEDATDPDTNAGRALLFFGEMLATVNGDEGLAFAAYNGGPSVIYASPAQWPQETQDYQFWASGIYEDAELGLSESPTLQAWLEAGGSSLCAEAAEILGLIEKPDL